MANPNDPPTLVMSRDKRYVNAFGQHITILATHVGIVAMHGVKLDTLARVECSDCPGSSLIMLFDMAGRAWYPATERASGPVKAPPEHDAQELNPWRNCKINDVVWVKDQNGWHPAHFAGVHMGKPYVYSDGRTSHTALRVPEPCSQTFCEMSLTSPEKSA